MDQIEQVPVQKQRRKILGMSAVLLPLNEDLSVDWESFRAHVRRTLDAGLVPAVNMDTGYAHLIDEATRVQVLRETREIASGKMYVAGAFVGDRSGAPFDGDAYRHQMASIQQHGGVPVLFQSYGLTEQDNASIVASYQSLASEADRFIGFELGAVFAPFGKIYSLEVYEQLVKIPQCIGAKHSSLDRKLEWQRLGVRNAIRPDFHVLTGNDLAIDMVMYGSDYLLGLSTMTPDLFALRDRYWEQGDPEFFHLNDWLQYLGFFTFRAPVPAYKHSAAHFLKLRKWIESDRTYPGSPTRPDSDRDVLATLLAELQKWI
ncbi:MAG: dihydrodipicolinate synthase family protein [Planctomycetota bacterium]|nr:dihydrodipicolinate synthase family protein [Planctomycetota bacterium]